MSKIKKIEIDREFTADGLTGLDIPYSATQSLNEKINENAGTAQVPLINKSVDATLDERGAYTIEGGTSFDLPPAIDFYTGTFQPWVINNVSGADITINAFGLDTIDSTLGVVTSVVISAGESATLYVIEPAVWGFSGAVQQPAQINTPTEDFVESNLLFTNLTNVPVNVVSKLTDPLDGDYLITISGQWGYSAGSRMLHAELLFDGAPIFNMDVEPKDTSNVNPFSWTGLVSGVGSKQIDFRAWSTNNGDITTIENCFLILTKRD